METSGNKRILETMSLFCISVTPLKVFCPITFQSLESPCVWSRQPGARGQGVPPLDFLLLCTWSAQLQRPCVQTSLHGACGFQSCVQMKERRNRKVNTVCQFPPYVHGGKKNNRRVFKQKRIFYSNYSKKKNASQTASSPGDKIALLTAFLIKKSPKGGGGDE